MAKAKKKDQTSGMEVDSKLLVKAIDRVTSVVTGNGAVYSLYFAEECYLIGVRDGTFCRVDLHQTSSGYEGNITLSDISAFKALVRNRGNVTLTPTQSTLQISSGRYKSEIKFDQMSDTAIIAAIESFMKRAKGAGKKTKALDVDNEFFGLVSKAVASTRLVNPFEDNFVSTASVSLKGNKLTVLAFDAWHIHLLETKVKTETVDFDICITTGIFSILDKVIAGNAQFSMSSEDFVIKGEDIVVVLPPVQNPEGATALQFMESLTKPMTTFSAETTNLSDTLENIAGLLKGRDKDGTKIELHVKTGALKLALSTDAGSVSDRFKIDKYKSKQESLNILVDPRIFYDTFKVIKTCVEFQFSVFPNEEGIPGMYSMKGKSDIGELSVIGYVGT